MGVAGGATRAAMTQHQARRDNMADVAAKDGSQVSKPQVNGINNTFIQKYCAFYLTFFVENRRLW